MATTQCIVKASEYYLNSDFKNLFATNIQLKEGDLLKITCQGGLQKLGNSYYKYDTNTAIPDFEFPVGSLVGTLDEGKTFFPIAGKLEIMCLDITPGQLSLVFWGVDENTTIGSVTLTVEVEENRALNEVKPDPESSNDVIPEISGDLIKDRFQFIVNADTNSFARKANEIPEPLLETGIQLKPGDLLIIDVSPQDMVNLGGFFTNANAIAVDGRRWGNYRPHKAHAYRVSSLIATIDDGKTFFPVGTHLQITVLNPGMLRFVCWDVDWTNNYGFVKPYVKVIRNGNILTSLDITTIQTNGNGSSSSSGTSNGTGSDYSDLDCTKNLPKLSAKLNSDLNAVK